MKQKFIEFLKAHNAHESFAQNALNDHHALVEDIMQRNRVEVWVSAGFDWGKTPQGQDYWMNLDIEWRNLIFATEQPAP